MTPSTEAGHVNPLVPTVLAVALVALLLDLAAVILSIRSAPPSGWRLLAWAVVVLIVRSSDLPCGFASDGALGRRSPRGPASGRLRDRSLCRQGARSARRSCSASLPSRVWLLPSAGQQRARVPAPVRRDCSDDDEDADPPLHEEQLALAPSDVQHLYGERSVPGQAS